MYRTSRITLITMAFILGVLVMAQVQTQRLTSKARASGSSADQAAILSSLVEANGTLRAEVDTLEAQLSNFRRGSDRGLLETLVEELNHTKTVNGLVEVSGPGIEVRLSGPLNALNVQDLVNELRNAGAEAIALNGERLVLWSAITMEKEGWLSVDGVRLASPYLFQAIGDPDTLETALMRSGGLIAVFQHTYEGLKVQISRRDRMVLPVHRQPPEFQYAVFVE